ncbi:hypothetical protein GOA75_11030 [Sinorhizobium meliloti]|nr:hypothetical protein [Sinorhizobium meliloti]MDW9630413.1 hypothetical protein [Sinorhizobium meliloti]
MGALVDLPAWAFYALMGALLGGISGAIGLQFDRFFGTGGGRYLAILGIVATPHVTDRFVLPAVIEAKVNRDLPKKLDEFTTLERISVESGKYVYFYTLAGDVSSSITGEEIKAFQMDSGLCSFWKPRLSSGEVSLAEYRYALPDGGETYFTVTRSDCL